MIWKIGKKQIFCSGKWRSDGVLAAPTKEPYVSEVPEILYITNSTKVIEGLDVHIQCKTRGLGSYHTVR